MISDRVPLKLNKSAKGPLGGPSLPISDNDILNETYWKTSALVLLYVSLVSFTISSLVIGLANEIRNLTAMVIPHLKWLLESLFGIQQCLKEVPFTQILNQLLAFFWFRPVSLL